MRTSLRRRRPLRRALHQALRPALRQSLAAVLAVGGLAACSDPFEIKPNLETIEASFTLYAFNGTAATAPTAAVLINTPQATRMGNSYTFDFAFDVTEDGRTLLYPVDVVASDIILPQNRFIGFQKATGQSYDQLVLAPTSGYTYGAPLEIAVGDVGFIQSNAHPLCAGSFTPVIYAKFRVDVIDTGARTVRLTVRSDPNCGFRGLGTGLPER